MLVAGAAPVGDAFAAQKGEVTLHTARPVVSPARTAPGELAIWLAVALAEAKKQILERAKKYGADEVMLTMITHKLSDKIESFRLLAEAFSL